MQKNFSQYLEIFKKAFTQADFTKIIDKYKEIILDHKSFWPKIKADGSNIESIYQNYLILLSIISPITKFFILYYSVPENTAIPYANIILSSFLNYFFALGLILVFAFIVEKLCPQFSGSSSLENAFKLVSFSMFPLFLAGIGVIIGSALVSLALLAASLYLFWLGIPVMLNVPEEKQKQAFIILTAGCLMAIIIITSLI